jgi:hypothetical protein
MIMMLCESDDCRSDDDDEKYTKEELDKAHTKLEKVHSSLLEQGKKEEDKKEQVNVSCDVGLTCDILDESCDASLMVKNETLKKEVNKLTRALGNAYGGNISLLKCLGSQRFSLNKEGLSYIPKKDKATFVTLKASFVKGNDQFCNRYK